MAFGVACLRGHTSMLRVFNPHVLSNIQTQTLAIILLQIRKCTSIKGLGKLNMPPSFLNPLSALQHRWSSQWSQHILQEASLLVSRHFPSCDQSFMCTGGGYPSSWCCHAIKYLVLVNQVGWPIACLLTMKKKKKRKKTPMVIDLVNTLD